MDILLIVTTILLLFIWGLLGELGFHIWREKIIAISKPKLPAEWVIVYVKLSRLKNRFRIAGPFGLIYALNYKTNKE